MDDVPRTAPHGHPSPSRDRRLTPLPALPVTPLAPTSPDPTMTRPTPLLLGAALLLATLPTSALAKDLSGHFGLGFNNQLGGGPALSVRYGIPTGGETPINLIVEGHTGFSSYDGTAGAFAAGGRLLFSTVLEDNMNFYVGAGAGYVMTDGVEVVRLQPLASIDIFLFGLDNLGLTTAFGFDIDVGGDTTGIATTTAALAGVTYWF